jgi:glycolate oxidase FAD binding subunit
MTTATSTASITTRVAAERDADVVDAIRDARAHGEALRIIGAGTWLDAGRPVAAPRHLDVARLSGITEYVPGDLTISARAGTTLAEIGDAARAHGQWLPLDPVARPGATLGATLATASAGPIAGTVGLPRDVTLGVTFVTGEGTLVRGGGRVVKNVAGFDLVRLMVGAWGTLGVIVEATVRLRARADVDETMVLSLPDEPDRQAELLTALRGPALMPLAVEMVTARVAAAVGLEAVASVLVRVAGSAAAVRAQRATLDRLGAAREAAPETWSLLQGTEPEVANVVRVSRRPSELPRLWRVAAAAADALEGGAHASVSRGVVRLWTRAAGDALATALDSLDGDDVRVFERLPASLWPALAPPRAGDAVSKRVRHAFDPDRLLNPRILGEPE